MERHPAMIRQNHKDGCLPAQKGTVRNHLSPWRRTGTVAPPRVQQRHQTYDPMPSLPGKPSPPGEPSVPETPSMPSPPPVPPHPIQHTQRLQTDNSPTANPD
jgi:hypothetical protein